jgi:hypothetical protein
MSDKLERFVKENKKQFDSEDPSYALWDKISGELDKKPSKKVSIPYKWMSIAALLVLSVGVYFGYQYRKMNGEIMVADVNPVMGKKEVRFTNLIEEKRDSLQIFAEADPVLYQKFITDLSKLDKDYQALKTELQTTPNKALVSKAMIRNLDLQLQVISQQLNIISQVNEFKKEVNSI